MVPNELPEFWRTFWYIVIFFAVGLPFALFLNLWAPLMYYRLQVKNREEWARQNGYRLEKGAQSLYLLDQVRQVGIFGVSWKGIVLDALYGPEVIIVDYTYLEYGASVDGGNDSRKGVTIFITEVKREMPEVNIWPKYKGIFSAAEKKSWTSLRKKFEARLDSFFPTVEIGDQLFNDVFRIRSHNKQAVEALLTPRVKEIMLRYPKATFHSEGRYLLVHEGKILANKELSRLVLAVLVIRSEINQ